MAAAAAAGLIAGEAAGAWRNRFVLAARGGAGEAALTGRIAVPDPTPAADADGPALIRALGLGEDKILGVLDTDEVAFLLARGEASAGLLHAGDLASRPGLETIRPVPESVAPPVVYRVAVTTLARRPNPRAFVDFLISPEGAAALTAHSLEIAA
ncbi:substrate-binding domain-containing protein, partial [Methylobacterium oryzisoli]